MGLLERPHVFIALFIIIQINLAVQESPQPTGSDFAKLSERDSVSTNKRWRRTLISFRPAEEIGRRVGLQHYGHGKDSETLPEFVTSDSHDGFSIKRDMDHVYYTSKFYGPSGIVANDLWVNIQQSEMGNVHHILSNTHRQTMTIYLSFDFSFYGHVLRKLHIATGGFIYTGDVIHKMLTSTQYIAPLMANFDLSISNNSSVIYCDNGTSLVVQWNHVYLQDASDLGSFSFQASLYNNGRITFAYKQVPVDISKISPVNHPVKVGLSDAFVVLHKIEQLPNVRRRTIYEYHRVELLKSKITNTTIVEMLPLPTCLQFSSCEMCVTAQIGFNCSWCSRLQRCSSGIDQYRQDWVDNGCLNEIKFQKCGQHEDSKKVHIINRNNSETTTVSTKKTKSSTAAFSATSELATESSVFSARNRPTILLSNSFQRDSAEKQREEHMQTGLLIGILLTMMLMVAVVLSTIYMYNHPTSNSSFFFIERRPTHWPTMTFRRGSGYPSYVEVEAKGQDKEGFIAIDQRDNYSPSDRRESLFVTDQMDEFIVPDQKERFLIVEHRQH